MTTKTKVLLISIIIALTLSIVGISIGLVLVAREASVSNSVSLSFSAPGVDANITSSGYIYDTKTSSSGKDIGFKNGIEKAYSMSFNDGVPSIEGAIAFNDATMTADCRVVYTFGIENTAPESDKVPLMCKLEFVGLTDNNVNIGVGLDDTALKPITPEESNSDGGNYFVCEIADSGETLINAVITVKDAMIDFTNLQLNIRLNLYYPEVDNENVPSITTMVINDHDMDSVIEFCYYTSSEDSTREGVDWTYSSVYGDKTREQKLHGAQIGNSDSYMVALSFKIYGPPAKYTFTYLDYKGTIINNLNIDFSGDCVVSEGILKSRYVNFTHFFSADFFTNRSSNTIDSNYFPVGATITITITPAS